MSTIVRQRLLQSLKSLESKLDHDAIETVYGLTRYLGRLTSMTKRDKDKCVAFKADNSGVVIGEMENALPQFLAEIQDMEKNQFATFAESRMYCEGTKNLMPILMIHHKIQTPKALVMSCPDSHIYRDGKAHLKYEDLEKHYDKKRSVIVSVIHQDGFLAFNYREEIKAA